MLVISRGIVTFKTSLSVGFLRGFGLVWLISFCFPLTRETELHIIK